VKSEFAKHPNGKFKKINYTRRFLIPLHTHVQQKFQTVVREQWGPRSMWRGSARDHLKYLSSPPGLALSDCVNYLEIMVPD